jgi:hypothetical protein
MEKQSQPNEAAEFLAFLQSTKPVDLAAGMVNLLADAEAVTRSASLTLQAVGVRLLSIKSIDEIEEIVRDIAAAQSNVDRNSRRLSNIGLPIYEFVVAQTGKTKDEDPRSIH